MASPLLANLFLHYALDRWLAAHYPQVPFERYADDVIVHCRTEKEAQEMRKAIAARLQSCGLELHPEKTKVVYCKDDSRKKTYPNEKFDFLGYTFRPRSSANRQGKFFINFSPAVSNQAAKAIRDKFRSWKLPQRSDKAIEDLSRMFNPIIRGWIQVLRVILSLGTLPDDARAGPRSGPLGQKEIQEAASPSSSGDTLDRADLAARSGVVRPLADGGAAWLHDGSCMS